MRWSTHTKHQSNQRRHGRNRLPMMHQEQNVSGDSYAWEHAVKVWSSNQAVIVQSSGEAEYYGLVRGASVAIGMRKMMKDLGVTCGIVAKTNASAAKSIASRLGVGKVRHIEVNQLWLQAESSKRGSACRKGGGRHEHRRCTYETS